MMTALGRAADDYAKRQMEWTKSDPRGRWVVLERGPGRLLRDAPRDIRDYVDAVTPLRGRRFSSLSRARKFAHKVGGTVRRWRRRMPGRRHWKIVGPWEFANGGMCTGICRLEREDPGA